MYNVLSTLPKFPGATEVLGTESGTGLVTSDGLKRKSLGRVLGYTYRSTNVIGGHRLSRLYRPAPLAGDRNRGIADYGRWGGPGPELKAWWIFMVSTYHALQSETSFFAAAV